jgi:hypothetical protein
MDTIIFKLDYWHRAHRRRKKQNKTKQVPHLDFKTCKHKKKAWKSIEAICAMINGSYHKGMLLSLIVSGSKAFTLDQLPSFLESMSKSQLSSLTRSVYWQILCHIFVVNGTYNNPLLIMKSGNSIGKPEWL